VVTLITSHSIKRRALAAHPRDPRVDREFGKTAARESDAIELSLLNSRPNGVIDVEDSRPAHVERVRIYVYKSHFQPYRSWFCILATGLFIIFFGWWVFLPTPAGFQPGDFVSCYISSLVCVLFWGGVKIWKWVDGEGPPTLRPDTLRILPETFLTAEVEVGGRNEGFGQKLTKFAKKFWWWIY